MKRSEKLIEEASVVGLIEPRGVKCSSIRAEEIMQMPAQSPEEICRLFQNYMAEGDIDAVLSLYDPRSGLSESSRRSHEGSPRLALGAGPYCRPEGSLRLYNQAGHPDRRHRADAHGVEGVGAEQMAVYAIEVARRQPDGTWCWLIGDPYTVGRRTLMKGREECGRNTLLVAIEVATSI
jgi:hypothetical protein